MGNASSSLVGASLASQPTRISCCLALKGLRKCWKLSWQGLPVSARLFKLGPLPLLPEMHCQPGCTEPDPSSRWPLTPRGTGEKLSTAGGELNSDSKSYSTKPQQNKLFSQLKVLSQQRWSVTKDPVLSLRQRMGRRGGGEITCEL